jgi:hypothetical protein
MCGWLRFLRGRIVARSSERASSSIPLPKAPRPVEPRTKPDQIEELERILSEGEQTPSNGPARPRAPRTRTADEES